MSIFSDNTIFSNVDAFKKFISPQQAKSFDMHFLLEKTLCNPPIPILSYLIDNGCNMNGTNLNGMTPLLVFADKGYFKPMYLMIKRGATISFDKKGGLFKYMHEYPMPIVHLILLHNPALIPDILNKITIAHDNDEMCLMYLAMFTKSDHSNKFDWSKTFIIPQAAKTNRPKIIEYIKNNWKMSDAIKEQLDDALYQACFGNNFDVVRSLVAAGANITDVRDGTMYGDIFSTTKFKNCCAFDLLNTENKTKASELFNYEDNKEYSIDTRRCFYR